MNVASKHIIKEAVLDFRYNGNTDGFAFQREVKEWFDEFSPLLEQMLDGQVLNDEVITVDQLEVEVDLNVTNWKEQATQKVSKQILDKLALLNIRAVQTEGFQKRKQEQQFKDLFLFYLVNGYLPWQVSGISSSQWDEELQNLISVADKEYVTKLKDVLLSSSSAAERLSQIIPFQSAVHLFSLLRKGNSVSQQQLLHDLQLLMKYSVVNHLNRLKQMIYHVYLQSVFAEADLLKMKDEVLILLKRKAMANPQLNLIETFTSFGFQSNLFKQIQTEVPDVIQNKLKRGRKPKSGVPVIIKTKTEHPAANKTAADEIYISDAGLVLIAAFLPALFEKTGLTVNNEIIDFNKAVCLVHFLATGSERMNEYELPLAKLLCGVETEQSIDAENFHLNPAMRNEAEAVLSSVVEYWSILQNTSVAGLRESFLKRNGKLSYGGKDWLLQVEQQPYDMLIQHLPWNFSMIKLPWMNCLLKTEWIF